MNCVASKWLVLPVVALTLFVCHPQAQGQAIYSDVNDGRVEMRSDWTSPSIQDTGDWNVGVGEWYGNGLLSAVMPFQLPNFGAVASPFTSASFGVNLYQKGNATATDADLYAVRLSASSAILASDYYSGANADPNATLIQASFLTPSSTTVPVDLVLSGANNLTDAAGSENLLNYLNSAYNSGVGAGQYVFLRVSYGSDTYATGWDAYNFTSRNAALEGDWPVITYTVAPVPEPGTAALVALGSVLLLSYRFRRK